jgi:poly(hydroxyalkanoate) granule-associated protein
MSRTASKPRRTTRPATRTSQVDFGKLQKSARRMIEDTRDAAFASAQAAGKAALARAGDARDRTIGALGQLEKVFEQRVSRAVTSLGVPSAKEVRELSRQVAQLQASVDRLRRSRVRARA